MAIRNQLIMTLLRIITPEEIADIATKHNGGRFLSLTDLVCERFEKKIYRNFTTSEAIEEIYEAHSVKKNGEELSAKILPFDKLKNEEGVEQLEKEEAVAAVKSVDNDVKIEVKDEHKESENLSSFILIEKVRLQKSQKSLKQKEIIDLYRKNSNIDVEMIKNTNQGENTSSESGVLVNKKQF